MSGPVLITGGAGSVGRILVSQLRQDQCAVRVFDLPSMNYAGLEGVDGIDEFGRHENQEFDFVDVVTRPTERYADDGQVGNIQQAPLDRVGALLD